MTKSLNKKNIEVLCTILISAFCLHISFGQEIKKLDESPLDFAYFRPNGIDVNPIARILYSRPFKKERKIFGGLVPYGKIWRTGANQSTELHLYSDIEFNNIKLEAGYYTIYTIPNKDEWIIIFNSKIHTWGDYDYDESFNVIKFSVPIQKTTKLRENFGIAFSGENGQGKILMAWDDVEVYIPFKY